MVIKPHMSQGGGGGGRGLLACQNFISRNTAIVIPPATQATLEMVLYARSTIMI